MVLISTYFLCYLLLYPSEGENEKYSNIINTGHRQILKCLLSFIHISCRIRWFRHSNLTIIQYFPCIRTFEYPKNVDCIGFLDISCVGPPLHIFFILLCAKCGYKYYYVVISRLQQYKRPNCHGFESHLAFNTDFEKQRVPDLCRSRDTLCNCNNP